MKIDDKWNNSLKWNKSFIHYPHYILPYIPWFIPWTFTIFFGPFGSFAPQILVDEEVEPRFTDGPLGQAKGIYPLDMAIFQ